MGHVDASELLPGTLDLGESSLYPALQRLLLRGWVKAEWGASKNNRRAKYYTLTPAGRKQLTVERQEFARVALELASPEEKPAVAWKPLRGIEGAARRPNSWIAASIDCGTRSARIWR
jgi:DNA-binding PadR family transcriptional regulator